jgi:hypothetical protein
MTRPWPWGYRDCLTGGRWAKAGDTRNTQKNRFTEGNGENKGPDPISVPSVVFCEVIVRVIAPVRSSKPAHHPDILVGRGDDSVVFAGRGQTGRTRNQEEYDRIRQVGILDTTSSTRDFPDSWPDVFGLAPNCLKGPSPRQRNAARQQASFC